MRTKKDRKPLVADPPPLNDILGAIDLNDNMHIENDILAEQISMTLS